MPVINKPAKNNEKQLYLIYSDDFKKCVSRVSAKKDISHLLLMLLRNGWDVIRL
jgi:hypothetical protein